MYKFSKELPISDAECFEALIEVSIAEIEHKTGKKVTRETIMSGYKYPSKKRYGRRIIDAKVHIKKPVLNRRFETSYSFENKTIEMTYVITPIDETHIKLEYIQDNGPDEIRGIAKFLTDRNMNKRFKGIAKYVLTKQ